MKEGYKVEEYDESARAGYAIEGWVEGRCFDRVHSSE